MMKNILFLISALFNCIAIHAQNTWLAKQNIPFGYSYSASFAIGNYGYVVGGVDPSFDLTNVTWQYDAINNSWTQKADAGVDNRMAAFGFSANGMGYIGCGFDDSNNKRSDLLQYNPATNSWTTLANMPVGRIGASCAVIGSHVYVACGASDDYADTVYNDLWDYDIINNSWMPKASLPGSPRAFSSGFSCGGNFYVGCGITTNANTVLSDFWMYDPDFDFWTQVSDLTSDPRYGAVSFQIGNYGFLGTGLDLFFSHNDFWKYDCSSDSWTSIATLQAPSRDAGFSFVINGKAYVGSGFDNNDDIINDVWEYTPDNTVSISKPPAGSQVINVLQNPVETELKLQFDRKLTADAMAIEIYDLAGKHVITRELSSANAIDVSNLEEGLYLFRILLNHKYFDSGRFIKIH